MKKIGTYFVIGLVVAFVGLLLFDIISAFFNGLPYDTGEILGMGVSLCVVVITCTGIIISKLAEKSDKKEKEKE